MGLGASSSERSTRDEKSVQADINKALKDSGGKWTSNLNDLVAERDRARAGKTSTSSRAGKTSTSSGGGQGFFDTVKAIPGGIARDVGMGFSANPFAGRDKQRENLAAKGYKPAQIDDYFARTDATKARMEAEAAARGDRDDRRSDTVTGAPVVDVPPEERMPVYRSPFGTAPPIGTTIGRPGPEITPQMRAAALQMFESQRGAGQIPYQMLPYQQGLGSIRREIRPGGRQPIISPIQPMSRAPDPFDGMRSTGGDQFMQPAVMPPMPIPRMPMPPPPMRQNPNVSPAFQYAAQNYQRLGGSQRLMDRPMEMMSAAERQRINEMSRAMAERQEYDMGRRMMGKGGGAVEPRRPLPGGFGNDVAPGMAGRSFGIASLRPMTTSGTFRRPVGTTGTFRDYIS